MYNIAGTKNAKPLAPISFYVAAAHPRLSAHNPHDMARCGTVFAVSYNFEIFEPLYIILLLSMRFLYISEITRRADLKPTFKRAAVSQNPQSSSRLE